MQGIPEISSILKESQGGIKQAIEAMRSFPNTDTEPFLRKYDEVFPRMGHKASIEAIATTAGVNTVTLLGAALLAIRQRQMVTSEIILRTSHPKIAKARIKFGLQNKGFRDRDKIDEALGITAKPTQPIFVKNINLTHLNDPEASNNAVAVEEDFPCIDDMLPEAHEIRRSLTLPAHAADAQPEPECTRKPAY